MRKCCVVELIGEEEFSHDVLKIHAKRFKASLPELLLIGHLQEQDGRP